MTYLRPTFWVLVEAGCLPYHQALELFLCSYFVLASGPGICHGPFSFQFPSFSTSCRGCPLSSLLLCARVLNHFRCVQLFVTPWTVAHPPGSSVLGISQARILEWVALLPKISILLPFIVKVFLFIKTKTAGKSRTRHWELQISRYISRF